jgi:hypothetical protein
MKSIRVSIAAAVTMVVVLSGLSAPAHGEPGPNAVTEWNLIAVKTLVGLPGFPGLPGPAGGAPPASQILMGMT